MSGVACMSRWPTTTRSPWLACVARLEVRLQDRGRRLLHLEDQRVVLVAALEHDDEAAGPDAPDADDLEGGVDETIALEEVATVLGKRRPVVGEELLERILLEADGDVRDRRRVVEDYPAAIDDGGQRPEGPHAVLAPRPC